MPSKSESQRRLMEASKHGEPWAVKKVPQAVGKEFADADEARAHKHKVKLPKHKNATAKHGIRVMYNNS